MAEASQTANPPPMDATALEIFQNQWDVYRKFLKYDYLSNGEAAGTLRRYLTDEVARPYSFLDLACGDASGIAAALKGTPVQRYRGVDLSAPALAIARTNLAALPCPAELDEADFSTALRDPSRAADIVWMSLSLHHLDTVAKLAFMREVRQRLDANGAFLIYEPARREGEDRSVYLDRLEAIGRRDWTKLTPEEFAEGLKHVRTCDLPETVSEWARLGHEAGFSSSRELYRSPTDLFRLFLYSP